MGVWVLGLSVYMSRSLKSSLSKLTDVIIDIPG